MFKRIKELTQKMVNFGKSRIKFISFKGKKENENINMQKVKEVRFISNSSGVNWNRVYEFF